MLVSLFVIIFYQNRDRDFLEFGKSESERAEQELQPSNNITDGVSGRIIAKVGDGIVSITSNTLEITKKNGKKEVESIAVSNPVVHSEGDYFLFYGSDGKEIIVKKEEKESDNPLMLFYCLTIELKILSATLRLLAKLTKAPKF